MLTLPVGQCARPPEFAGTCPESAGCAFSISSNSRMAERDSSSPRWSADSRPPRSPHSRAVRPCSFWSEWLCPYSLMSKRTHGGFVAEELLGQRLGGLRLARARRTRRRTARPWACPCRSSSAPFMPRHGPLHHVQRAFQRRVLPLDALAGSPSFAALEARRRTASAHGFSCTPYLYRSTTAAQVADVARHCPLAHAAHARPAR